jgi:hypothetical protein
MAILAPMRHDGIARAGFLRVDPRRKAMLRSQRFSVTIALALAASLALAGAGWAAPKVGQRASDCKTWDCSGGIICSCCFSNGCWICDAEDGKPADGVNNPGYARCHWEDAVRNQGTTPDTIAPGGGVLDPGIGGSVMPKFQQLPTLEGTTQ